jgi:integrase
MYTFNAFFEVNTMSRSRPASNPISYHKRTKQYYVTRSGRRIYLGADREEALDKYYRLNLGLEPVQAEPAIPNHITMKELANRFLTVQQANWQTPTTTLKSYKDWLGRFLKDNPKAWVADFTVERFAAWKLSLMKRGYSPESINHYLTAVRSMFIFAEDTGIIDKAPKLRRVKNQARLKTTTISKPLYTLEELQNLLGSADLQMKTMILLALNCGFGLKDMRDLTWKHIDGDRVTLPRSKTGICQTYLMWIETCSLLEEVRHQRDERTAKALKRGAQRCDNGHIFVTRYWRPWNKDAIGLQFNKLCKKAKVPCYGFYRLRHCASTAMSLVSTPHVQRKFMRHGQLQQQVVYTHIPDAEVDAAIAKTKAKLLGQFNLILSEEKSRE